ncbi:MAG: Sec-dependent nitrous-oxide reductase [Gemmatimonadota bacterium]
MSEKFRWALAVLVFTGVGMGLSGCAQEEGLIGAADAAERVYVAPGEYDEFYAFLSGGYSGQLSVWGLPSARLFRVIPVFSQDPETGYGYSEETKAMLKTSYGDIPWDDSHHPVLSRTDGTADGRWIFINGNNTPRIARIDLTKFETVEILELPNTGGNHASSFVTENTEYVFGASRFSIPAEQDLDVPIDSYKENFDGALTFVKVDPETGRMEMDFQIQVPPYHYDLARSGMGVSGDWVFFTSYNTEQAHTLMEIEASRNDKDFILAVNWRRASEAAANGAGQMVPGRYYHNEYDPGAGMATSEELSGVRLLQPSEVAGGMYFLPTPKSPHGVDIDPTGEFIVAGGKLATVIPVHSFSRMQQAIADGAIVETIYDIPVLDYDRTIIGEVENPGLGPLHTEFDGRGFAYTSVYISSEIVKWSLETFEVVDRIDAYYSIGHLMLTQGDTRDPQPKYLVGLTKTARDRFLPVGPKQNHPAQLYDVSGDRMVLLKDFPTIGEPHYAQALRADLIQSDVRRIYELADNQHPRVTRRSAEARVEREGKVVRVYMTSIRSHFTPDNIEGVELGDTVYFHVTNLEQDWDVTHGIAIKGAQNAEIILVPGQTKTLKWVPTRTGIYPFYCTAFCSALHQEMQGYVRVSPEGSGVPISWRTGTRGSTD